MNCRLCSSPLHHLLIDLGDMPLSNGYLANTISAEKESRFPMKVYTCSECWLTQLAEYEKAENIFNADYAYFSSFSSSWVEHCRKYAETVIHELGLNAKSLVIEVASNDGYLLKNFKASGVPVLGIEPTRGTAQKAIEQGITTEVCFFGKTTAKAIKEKYGLADLMIGNNVVAHVPDLNDFLAGYKTLLAPNGVMTLEFPHMLNLVMQTQFDTIYHEHFSYFLLKTMKHALARQGLELFNVEELTTHGGSLRIYAKHQEDSSKPVNARVDEIIKREDDANLFTLVGYTSFTKQVQKIRNDFIDFLKDCKAKGKTVAAYGAPAKGNTFLNYCHISANDIPFTCDLNPQKAGKLLPGSHIPIYSPDKIDSYKPDFVVILPWNLSDEISNQLKNIRNWGGKFVVAIPNLKVF